MADLIWEERFNDLSKWRVHHGGMWDGGRTLQQYTQRFRNVRVGQHGLTIEAHQETYTGADGVRREFTSGRIDSRGKLALLSGYIEVAARIEMTAGAWPAIWTLGGESGYGRGWPGGGELDIVEAVGKALPHKEIRHTVHAATWRAGWTDGGIFPVPDMETAFHLYGVAFDANRVQFYIDRKSTLSVVRGNRTQAEWPFGEVPQWVVLNYAIGGSGGDTVGSSWPRKLEVAGVWAFDSVPVATEPAPVPELTPVIDPALREELEGDLTMIENRAASIRSNYKSQKLKDAIEAIEKRARTARGRLN